MSTDSMIEQFRRERAECVARIEQKVAGLTPAQRRVWDATLERSEYFDGEREIEESVLDRLIAGSPSSDPFGLMPWPVIHLMVGSSAVACGLPMRQGSLNRAGWDLGSASADPGRVTCPVCL